MRTLLIGVVGLALMQFLNAAPMGEREEEDGYNDKQCKYQRKLLQQNGTPKRNVRNDTGEFLTYGSEERRKE